MEVIELWTQILANLAFIICGWVTKLLDGINVHKASGPDGLNDIVLQECSNEISTILAHTFNESLTLGDVPDDTRQSKVSPTIEKR